MTLNRKSEGQGHRERSQFRRSHQGLFPCKVSSLYWLMQPRTNLNTEVNQNVDRQTDGRTEGQTDRRTSSIHKPELLCNPANKNTCGTLAIDCNLFSRTWNLALCKNSYKMALCIQKESWYFFYKIITGRFDELTIWQVTKPLIGKHFF